MDADLKNHGDDQAAENCADVSGTANESEGLSLTSFFGDLHGDGASDRHNQMFAQTPDHDQQCDQHFIGWNKEG
jgi:hypothetical protein